MLLIKLFIFNLLLGTSIYAKSEGFNEELLEAAGQGDISQYNAILEKGEVDLNAVNDEGITFLHSIIQPLSIIDYGPFPVDMKRVDILSAFVKPLLNKGANMYAQTKYARKGTPVHWAVGHNFDALLIFLEAGADMEVRDGLGRTPLFWVRGLSATKTLLNKKVDVNARDNIKMTPLHMLIQSADPNVVSYVLNAGADVHAEDQFGRRPLHYATRWAAMMYDPRESYPRFMLSKIGLLLSMGADPHVTDNQGMSSIDLVKKIAQERNLSELTDILELLKGPTHKGTREFLKGICQW